jgi:WD40 repeat protein
MDLETLPAEVLENIFEKLDLKSLGHICAVSKHFYKILGSREGEENQNFWKKYYFQHYELSTSRRSWFQLSQVCPQFKTHNWKHAFREKSVLEERWNHEGSAWGGTSIMGDVLTAFWTDPRGEMRVTGSEDGFLYAGETHVWEAFAPFQLKELQAHPQTILALDGLFQETSWGKPLQMLVSGSCDTTVKVWDLNDFYVHCYILESHKAAVSCVKILYWQEEEQTRYEAFEDLAEKVRIASGSRDGTIFIWQPQNENSSPLELKSHKDEITALDTTTWKTLLSSSADKTIKIWNIENGNCLSTIELEIFPNSIQVHLDHFIAVSSKEIQLWAFEDSNSNTKLKTRFITEDTIFTAKFDGTKLIYSTKSKFLVAYLWNTLRKSEDKMIYEEQQRTSLWSYEVGGWVTHFYLTCTTTPSSLEKEIIESINCVTFEGDLINRRF